MKKLLVALLLSLGGIMHLSSHDKSGSSRIEGIENPNGPLLKELLSFYQERDWEQFHSPKNLVMDLTAETGELGELFRWLTEEQSRKLDEKTLQEVRGEIADIYKCIIYLSYTLGIDPIEATYQKLEKMKQKYPVEACRGKALKYTEYEEK